MAKVICPSCGGENEVIGNRGKSCEYCGTMVYPPKVSNITPSHEEGKMESFGEYLVLRDYQFDKGPQIISGLKQNLVNLDTTPIDVFDHLEIDAIEYYFLPMVRVKGRVSTKWSCNQIIKKKREVGQRAIRDDKGNIQRWETEYEEYDDYLAKHGEGSAQFDFLTKCGESITLPKGVSKIYDQIDFSKIKPLFIPWDQSLLENHSAIPENSVVNLKIQDLKSKEILNPIGSKIDHMAYNCSFGNFSPNERTNENYTKNVTLDPNNSNLIYFVPFVCVKYHYKNQECEWAVLQNPNIKSFNAQVPIDQAYTEYLENRDSTIKQRNTIYESISWSRGILLTIGIILALVFGFCALLNSSSPWIFAFFLMGVLSIFIGALMFFLRNPVHKLVGRMNKQLGLLALRNKLLRKFNLAKNGEDCRILHLNKEYLDGDHYAEYFDETPTPKTVEEIDEYTSKTNSIKKHLYTIFYVDWILFIIGTIAILSYAGTKSAAIKEYEYQERIEQEAEEQRKTEIRATGDLGEMGFPKGVKTIEVQDGSDYGILDFDKQGNLTKVQIKKDINENNVTTYEISDGKIVKSTHSNGYEPSDFWGGQYQTFPERFVVTYRYDNDSHSKVSGGKVTTYSEPAIYASIKNNEQKIAVLKNGHIEWESSNRFPIGFILINKTNDIYYTFPNLAMELLGIKLEMPENYEFVSGTPEKPTEIINFGKITYYDD